MWAVLCFAVLLAYAPPLLVARPGCSDSFRATVQSTFSSSLALHLAFDERTGSTYHDYSGHSRTGTETSRSGTSSAASLMPGGVGRSRTGFQSAMAIVTTSWAKPIDSWAVCVFARVTAAPNAPDGMPLMSDDYGGVMSRALYINELLQVVLYQYGGSAQVHVTQVVALNTAYFICGGFNGATGQSDVFVYKSGAARADSSVTGATQSQSTTVSNSIYLGADGYKTNIAPGQFDLDEVIVWDSYGGPSWAVHFDALWQAAQAPTCTKTRTKRVRTRTPSPTSTQSASMMTLSASPTASQSLSTTLSATSSISPSITTTMKLSGSSTPIVTASATGSATGTLSATTSFTHSAPISVSAATVTETVSSTRSVTRATTTTRSVTETPASIVVRSSSLSLTASRFATRSSSSAASASTSGPQTQLAPTPTTTPAPRPSRTASIKGSSASRTATWSQSKLPTAALALTNNPPPSLAPAPSTAPTTSDPTVPPPTPSASPTSPTSAEPTTTAAAFDTSAPISATPLPATFLSTEPVTPVPFRVPDPTANPTPEPTMPSEQTVVPTVVGSMALELDVASVRRRSDEFRAALAAVAQVHLSAVVILSILPGSTVVRFQIATNRPLAEVQRAVTKALSAEQRASSPLAPFFPIAESFTLRTSSRVLFAIGVAFYVMVGLAAATLAGLGAWFLYRKWHPDVVSNAIPVAAVSGGVIRVQVVGDAAKDVSDDAPDFIVIGARGPLTEEDVVRIPAGTHSEAVPSFEDKQLAALTAAPRAPRRRRREPQRYSPSPDPLRDCTQPSLLLLENLPTPRRTNPGFRMALSQLQPSREVVDGDIAASYALE